MQLFEVIFRVVYELVDEDIEDEEDEGVQEIRGVFHILSENYLDAVDETMEHMEEHFDGIPYELLSITKLDGIHIVNGGDNPDAPLVFRCSYCHESVVLPGSDWSEEPCPRCGKRILRDRLIQVGKGRWMMISEKEDKE